MKSNALGASCTAADDDEWDDVSRRDDRIARAQRNLVIRLAESVGSDCGTIYLEPEEDGRLDVLAAYMERDAYGNRIRRTLDKNILGQEDEWPSMPSSAATAIVLGWNFIPALARLLKAHQIARDALDCHFGRSLSDPKHRRTLAEAHEALWDAEHDVEEAVFQVLPQDWSRMMRGDEDFISKAERLERIDTSGRGEHQYRPLPN